MSSKFEFSVEDSFSISSRGIVFRGKVISGSLDAGEKVSFTVGNDTYSARVEFIELNKKLIDKTVNDAEIGMLLNEFDPKDVNEIYLNMNGQAEYRSPQEIMGLEYPFLLKG